MSRALLLLVLLSVALVGGAVPAAAVGPVQADGDFSPMLDLRSLTATPVGTTCLLTVDGALDIDGTLDGVATGTTTALVAAPCEEATTQPPGTFSDVFRSSLDFEGSVDGEPVTAQIVWRGTTRPGGAITGVFTVRGPDVNGALRTSAQILVGGTYAGRLVVD